MFPFMHNFAELAGKCMISIEQALPLAKKINGETAAIFHLFGTYLKKKKNCVYLEFCMKNK